MPFDATGINIKPWRGVRGSDVAIVSDEAAGHYNRLRSQGPLDERVRATRAYRSEEIRTLKVRLERFGRHGHISRQRKLAVKVGR